MRTAHAGPVTTVTFDRPESGNVLTDDVLDGLHRAFDDAEAAGGRALVLRADGDVFCAGMDFAEAAPEKGHDVTAFFDLLERCTTSGLLVVAVVEGRAVGGGVGLVAAADFAVAGPRAQFQLPEALWGLLPCAVLPFLVRRIGFQRAQAMALGTLAVPARRAADIGLVDELADDPDLVVRRLLGRVTRFGPGVVAAAKAYGRTLSPVPDDARDRAAATFRELSDGPTFRGALDRYVRDGRFPWEVQN